MDPKSTAVVFIEYQNDFTTEGGTPGNLGRANRRCAKAGAGRHRHRRQRGLDGFATTNLDFILRGRGISTIALGGFLTNCCVESTMRTGYEKGYDVITLKDCTATISEEEQRAAVEKNYPMFSKPMTHDEFLSGLKSGKAVETKSRGYEAA